MSFKSTHIVVVFSLMLMRDVGECSGATPANTLFRDGIEASRMGEFSSAAQSFREAAVEQPASGTLLNLGIAEWRRGRVGAAILAWEQALWINPLNRDARNNLDFARQFAQLESPDLAWYEVASSWLPARVWGWLAGGSLSLIVALITLPQVLRWRKAGWHQALAALGLGVFLLSIPANVGIVTRSHVAFIIEKNTPLRLTPTEEAEAIRSLTTGEPARKVRVRGDFVFIRTQHDSGWVKRRQLGLVCPDS